MCHIFSGTSVTARAVREMTYGCGTEFSVTARAGREMTFGCGTEFSEVHVHHSAPRVWQCRFIANSFVVGSN